VVVEFGIVGMMLQRDWMNGNLLILGSWKGLEM
jgi:hypothetical protein